jgi:hypothetical protein
VALTAEPEDRVYGEQGHERAAAAMREIADRLTEEGMDIHGQVWKEVHYLKAANVWGALCEATVGANGMFAWEYRPLDGAWDDPEQAAAMAGRLLGADEGGGAAAPVIRYPGQAAMAAAGLRARGQGLRARLAELYENDDLLEVAFAIEITNPARPERGRVLIGNGAVTWECRMAGYGKDGGGLSNAEISGIVGASVPQLAAISTPGAGG